MCWCCCSKDVTPRLVGYESCPEYLMGNQFVLQGYRVGFSKSQCLKSLVVLSNETVNIWTHMLGSAYFVYLIYYINWSYLYKVKGTGIPDHVIMTSFCLCFLVCLCLSSAFHAFGCHSRYSYRMWLRLDLTGITLSVWGCYIPSIYYGFYCFQFWRHFYTGSVVLVMLLNMMFQNCYRTMHNRLDLLRISFMVFAVLVGICPAAHWVVLSGGVQSTIVQLFLPRIVVMYGIGSAAFLFYVAKIPERFFPGWFDYFGASHQIWHLLIVFAFHWWYQSAVSLLEFQLLHSKECSRLQ